MSEKGMYEIIISGNTTIVTQGHMDDICDAYAGHAALAYVGTVVKVLRTAKGEGCPIVYRIHSARKHAKHKGAFHRVHCKETNLPDELAALIKHADNAGLDAVHKVVRAAAAELYDADQVTPTPE